MNSTRRTMLWWAGAIAWNLVALAIHLPFWPYTVGFIVIYSLVTTAFGFYCVPRLYDE